MSSESAVILVSRQDDPTLNQTVKALSSFRVAHILIDDLNTSLPSAIQTMAEQCDGPIVLLPFLLQLLPHERVALENALHSCRSLHPETTVTLAAPIGYDRRIAELTEERISAAATESSQAEKPILTLVDVDGQNHAFGYKDLDALPDRLPDIGTRVGGREGEAVPVHVLLNKIGYTSQEGELVFRSGSDFSAEVSSGQARNSGFLVYKLDNGPLPARYGGPVRLFIPGGDDRCSNVKCIDKIEILS